VGHSDVVPVDLIPRAAGFPKSLNRKDKKSMKDMKDPEGIKAAVHRT